MARQSPIKKFVRQVLGCTCPDKVFEQIEDKHVAPAVSPHTRVITIGGRLLIYIWEANEPGQFKEKLPAMLAAGRKERNERGLNRFRAVLATDETNQNIAAEAALYFSQFAGRDDRMHLHVVPQNALSDL
ncbi:MAG: hypothetical protein AMJ61_16925 [Desulfobacterales bacterium SG8_35_2]|nr:MAG: hypothetical protein AMJ61_16925 [Desulfobacterales bacterium SG8_35_2]